MGSFAKAKGAGSVGNLLLCNNCGSGWDDVKKVIYRHKMFEKWMGGDTGVIDVPYPNKEYEKVDKYEYHTKPTLTEHGIQHGDATLSIPYSWEKALAEANEEAAKWIEEWKAKKASR